MYVLLLVVTFFALGSSIPLHEDRDIWKESPLILTPYIESGKIQEARDKALVTQLKPNITSYAGFFNVDKKCDSNLFFWFFPSQNNLKTDPVSVWLNGGPGSPSTFGLFTENGPYDLSMDLELKLREYSWNRNSSVIYIDNPVGTGFSFTRGPFPDCYARNETHIGQSFLVALEQFFKLFPEIRNNPFYLTGESYAGKYIPAIAYTILHSNTSVRLSGIAIGNSYTDPYTQISNSDFFYNLGFIDEETKNDIHSLEDRAQQLIRENKYKEASDYEEDATDEFLERSKIGSIYNYLLVHPEDEPDFMEFMNRTEIRRALHVGNATLNEGEAALNALLEDLMKTVKPWLEDVMNNYRVLLYFGQMDLRVGYTPSVELIKRLNWKGAADYKKAKRKTYKVDDEVAGYIKTAGNFTEILIRNAGHMVPTDQPKWALDMYNKFIYNIAF